MKPALNEFVFAGIYVTRLVARPTYVSSELMHEHILSLSGCLANFIPDTWCIQWSQDALDSRLEEAETFELDSTALAEVTKWVTPQFGTHFAWQKHNYGFGFRDTISQAVSECVAGRSDPGASSTS
jgi:hypothetical protein